MDFVALDVETANSQRGSICAIGLAVVENGRIIKKHRLLTKPAIAHFEQRNIQIHGITPEDVEAEPPFSEQLDKALSIIGDLPVVAHNASFDISAIRKSCIASEIRWPTFTFGCSCTMSRRALRLVSYRLPIVAEELGIEFYHHHQPEEDAEVCANIVLRIAEMQNVTTSLVDLANSLHLRLGEINPDGWNGCVGLGAGSRPPAANTEADPSHPFYGKFISFTGKLSIDRSDAQRQAAILGATPQERVTEKTNILVVGDGFSGERIEEFRSTRKALRAIELMESGHDIEVLTETDFFQMLDE